MSNSKACVLDHSKLGELNNALEYAGDSVLKIQNAIAEYLRGVIEVMEQQLEVIQRKFEEAKDALSVAQEELDDCLASQEYDPETGDVYPSCSCERSQVRHAEAECKKWEERYEIAKEVVSQCKAYKSDWEYQDIFVCGGDCHLDRLGHQRTDDATSKLRKIIEVLEKYLRISISPNGNTTTEDVKVLDKYDVTKIIRDSDYKERKEQIHELNRHDAVAANRVAKCPRCGRALSICICGNSRKNIELI